MTLRRNSMKSSKNLSRSTPSVVRLAMSSRADLMLFEKRFWVNWITKFWSERGMTRPACSWVIFFSPSERTCWSKLSASRIHPSLRMAMVSKTSGATSTCSDFMIFCRRLTRSLTVTFLKSNLWQREIMVSGILWGSVVARIKMAWLGGSSKVLSRALKASVVSMWTSSIIKTLNFPCEGEKRTFSRSWRISSMPLLEAASISIKSRKLPAISCLQWSHLLQDSASPSFLFSQLTDLANRRAVVVLPVPLGPVKR